MAQYETPAGFFMLAHESYAPRQLPVPFPSAGQGPGMSPPTDMSPLTEER